MDLLKAIMSRRNDNRKKKKLFQCFYGHLTIVVRKKNVPSFNLLIWHKLCFFTSKVLYTLVTGESNYLQCTLHVIYHISKFVFKYFHHPQILYHIFSKHSSITSLL